MIALRKKLSRKGGSSGGGSGSGGGGDEESAESEITSTGMFGFPGGPKRQQQQETIVNPEDYDILLGRGRTSWGHVGNRRFRTFVGLHLKKYMEANSRSEKSKIVHTIYDDIMKGGGRFLKNDTNTGLWHPVDRKSAREKIAHALRDAVGLRIKITDTPLPPPQSPGILKAHMRGRRKSDILMDRAESLRQVRKTQDPDSTDDTKDDSTASTNSTPPPPPAASPAIPPPPVVMGSPAVKDSTPRIQNFSRKFLPGRGRMQPQRAVSVPVVTEGPKPTVARSISLDPAATAASASAAATMTMTTTTTTTTTSARRNEDEQRPEALANMVSHVLNEMEASGELLRSSAKSRKIKALNNIWIDEDLSGGFSVMSLDSRKEDADVSAEFSIRSSVTKSRMSLDDIEVSGDFGFDMRRSIETRRSHHRGSIDDVDISEEFGLALGTDDSPRNTKQKTSKPAPEGIDINDSGHFSLDDLSLMGNSVKLPSGRGGGATAQEGIDVSEELSVRSTDTEQEWRKTVKALAAV